MGPIICQPCGDEVIPGDMWTDADSAAWLAEHGSHRPARSVADDVREALRDVDGVRSVAPTVIGDEARVEVRSLPASDEVRRVLLAAGWAVTEIGHVTMVRGKGGVV